MVIKDISEDYIKIFFSNIYLKKIDFDSKKDVECFLKNSVLGLKNRYGIYINGLYDTKIYVNNKFGFFLVFKKIDSLFSEESIDFRVSIIKNSALYYKTGEYDIIKNHNKVYYYEGNFYVELTDEDDLIFYVEHGEFVINDNFNIDFIGIRVN